MPSPFGVIVNFIVKVAKMVNEENNYVTIIDLFHITDCNNTGGFHWVSSLASRGFLWGSCNWDNHTIMIALRAKYLSGTDARCNQYC